MRDELASFGVPVDLSRVAIELVGFASLVGGQHSYGQTNSRWIDFGSGREFQSAKIQVVSNLGPELFDSVVAHELVHVWFAQRWKIELDPCTTEGLCQLAAASILKLRKHSLAGYLLWKMSKDPSYEYGECYRRALNLDGAADLRRVAQEIRRGRRL